MNFFCAFLHKKILFTLHNQTDSADLDQNHRMIRVYSVCHSSSTDLDTSTGRKNGHSKV